MTKLELLQNQFIETLYNANNTTITAAIKNGKIKTAQLIQIYRNNLILNLQNTLRLTYPKIYKLLGAKSFNTLAHKFIQNSRSFSGNLDNYGEDFAIFLKQNQQYFLADLAKLEWLRQLAYLAKNAKDLDISLLQKLSTDQLANLKFKIAPGCFLLESSYNLFSNRISKKPSLQNKYYLVFRFNLEVNSIVISRTDFQFLKAVKNNNTLSEMHDLKVRNVSSCLHKFIVNKIITEFTI